jgi:integrase
LWWSGLRLGESLDFHWTDTSKICVVNLDKRHPIFQIPSKCQKNNKNRLLPMAPELAEFLRAVEDRSGYVFDPKSRRPSSGRLGEQAVGRTVCQIGERAGIKVNENKFASAHGLRRSFGTRWSAGSNPKSCKK